MSELKKKENPIASILIPVLNEEQHIGICLDSILYDGDINYNVEIIILDGGSTDKTLEIINSYINKSRNIKILNNEKKFIPDALNLGILNSNSEYIIRLDAHTVYSADYINKCIETIKNSPADVVNVGGIIKTVSTQNNIVGNAIADVLSSKFGVGNSIFRVSVPNKNVYVDTVPFGCFKKSIFDEIGLFNVKQHRNEDLEFNYRIVKNSKKIILNPEIVSMYYVRDDFKKLIKQQFHNGLIVTNRIGLDGLFHSLRHFVPLLWILYILFSVLILSSEFKLPSVIVSYSWIVYFIVIFLLAIYYSILKKKLNKIFLIPITLILIHGAYGIGSIFGLLKFFKNIIFNKNK